ncbi:MAG: OmpA family protein [Acidobacteriota bacterium]
MIANRTRLSMCLVLLWTAGCASTGQPPQTKITAEVISMPAGIEMSYRGKILGKAPLEIEIDRLDEAVELAVTQDEPPLIERRIKVLSPERIQVLLRLGSEPSPVAKALGLNSVIVFDYGSQTTFDSDSYEIGSAALPVLRRQAETLASYFAGLDVYVCGHTDSTGGDDHNEVLSLNRAQSVADFLIAEGLDSEKIRVQGFGADYPLAVNTTREGRAANRRTEIILPD